MVAAASGVLLFLFMSVNWFTVSNDPTAAGRRSAWETFSLIDLALFAIALTAVGIAIARGAGADFRSLPVSSGLLVGALGLIACGLIVFRLFVTPDLQIDYGGASPDSVEERGGVVDRDAGIYLGLAASVGILVGGFASLRERARRTPRRM